MTTAKYSDFFTPSPLVRKSTQPPLLRLLTMSAFEGTPLAPQCERHIKEAPLRQRTRELPCSLALRPSSPSVAVVWSAVAFTRAFDSIYCGGEKYRTALSSVGLSPSKVKQNGERM